LKRQEEKKAAIVEKERLEAEALAIKEKEAADEIKQ
jgi:hypothetical protein